MNQGVRDLLRLLVYTKASGMFVGSLEHSDVIRDLNTIDDFQRFCERNGIEIEIKLKSEQE